MRIHELLRAQDVKRWGIVRMAKQQTLAEHSFNVAMIARAFAKVLDVNDEQITKAALCHDLDEIKTGDIPTPFKDAAREQGVELNDIYQHATGRTLSMRDEKIIKLADIVEAAWFCHEYGMGNHAENVFAELDKKAAMYLRENFTVGGEEKLSSVISLILHGEHEV